MQRADKYPFKDKIALVAEGCLPGAYFEPINVGSACEQAARGARWSEDKDTPSATGSITFTITPK